MVTDSAETSRLCAGGPDRVLVASLAGARAGEVLAIDADQARHLVRVRRRQAGAALEAFDAAGLTAAGALVSAGKEWGVRLSADAAGPALRQAGVWVYSAIPKGPRADWMVEKLSELGVEALVPLITQRSVVEPGAGKLQRFDRLARESAKQSRRAGILRIEQPASLEAALERFASTGGAGAVLTTERQAPSLAEIGADALFIGPEGGWTPAELDAMTAAGLLCASLTSTVLRIETAAICAAALVQVRRKNPGAAHEPL